MSLWKDLFDDGYGPDPMAWIILILGVLAVVGVAYIYAVLTVMPVNAVEACGTWPEPVCMATGW
jgi:hypothetical protein